MKKITIILFCWFLTGCAAIQSKSDDMAEKNANKENMELETSDFFDNNSTDYIVKSIIKFSLGKQEHWGTIESSQRSEGTLFYDVKNYHWSGIRTKGFFNPFKKTRTRKYGFEIPNSDGDVVSCECSNYAYKKNYILFKKFEEYLDCEFSYKDNTYNMNLSEIPSLEDLFPILRGDIDNSELSVVESHKIKGSKIFGRQGYIFYKQGDIDKESFVTDPYKFRILNSAEKNDIPLNLAMALSVRQYQNLTDNWDN